MLRQKRMTFRKLANNRASPRSTTSAFLFCRDQRFVLQNLSALLDHIQPVHVEILQRVDGAGRPANLYAGPPSLLRPAQNGFANHSPNNSRCTSALRLSVSAAPRGRVFVRGVIKRSSRPRTQHWRARLRNHFDARPNSRAIALRPHNANLDPAPIECRYATKQLRNSIDAIHDCVHVRRRCHNRQLRIRAP